MVLCLAALLTLQSPTWRAQVGTYEVVKWRSHDESGIETLFIKDAKGRVVTCVQAEGHVGLLGDLYSEKPVKPLDVNRDGIPEVIIEAWSGGAHGSNTYFVWSLGKVPRCMLAYNKNNVCDEHDFDLVDLDHDGILEIRSWYDGFAYTVGGSCWRNLPVVLKLKGGRYVDRTSDFHSLLRQAEKNEWHGLMTSDKSAIPESWSSTSSPAIGLIALADIMGHRAATWKRLTKLIPSKNIKWLRNRESTILAIIRGRNHRYQYPKAYKTRPASFGPFFPPESLTDAFR